MRLLDHHRMEVYQLARELSREVCRVMKLVRPGRRDLVLQLLRALASIPLNIAEGAGEFSPGRKAYFYRIARSSATECDSNLEHMVDMGMLLESEIRAAQELIARIVPMLVNLTRHVESADSYPPLKPIGPRQTTQKPTRRASVTPRDTPARKPG